MSDSVKFIFKTLIKVPCYIMVAYFILNIFAFAHTYFKMLGFSYVVMQTAVENNYLPETEYNQLNSYLSRQGTSFCANPRIVIHDAADGSILPAYGHPYSRRQYGSKVCVGVEYDFRMIWPLMPVSSTEATTAGVDTWNSQAATYDPIGDPNDPDDDMRDRGNGWNHVVIKYTVPGLKYYPDLSS